MPQCRIAVVYAKNEDMAGLVKGGPFEGPFDKRT